MNLKKKTGLLIAFASLFSGAADTQEVGPSNTDVARVGLEEIIVTATKREEASQDIGKAINVFDSEALDRAGIQDVSRLEHITPGLAFAQRGNDVKLTIRGANAENTLRTVPVPNGVFVDGLYRVRAAQQGNAFLDVGSVEVLKGPQGTLFGRNTLGGAVLVKTNKPDTEANDYSLAFTVGDYSLTKLEGVANLAVSDSFALRVAASTADADGWIENLGPSEDLGAVDDTAIRISALWNINDNFSALLSHFSYDSGGSALGAFGYHSRDTLRDPNSTDPLQTRQTHAAGIHDPVNSRGGSLGVPSDTLGPWQIFRDGSFDRNVTEDTTSLELTFSLGAVDVKSLSAYTSYSNLSDADGDYSAGRLLEESFTDDMDAMSQKLQFSWSTENTDWVTGLYYANEDFTQGFFRTWLGFATTGDEAAQIAAGTLDVADLARCNNAFGTVATAAAQDPNDPTAVCPGQFAGNPRDLENTTYGIFAHSTFNLSERSRLIIGARYSKNEMDLKGGSTLRSTGVLGETTISPVTVNTPSEDWSKATWEVGYERDVFEDSLFYASVSTGFLSGGLNVNQTTFGPQEITAYEVGLKNRLLDNTLELNVSLYHNELEELLAAVLDGNSLTTSTNGGEVTANGLEVDLKALVSENMTVVANMAFQDSTYGDFLTTNRFQLNADGSPAGGVGGVINLNGLDTPWAPTFSGNLSVSYDIHGGSGVFTPHIQLSYSGDHTTTGLQQFELAEQDAYAKLDLRLYWQSASESWNTQFYVENVTEEEVLQTTQIGGSDIIQSSYGKPRMYGMKAGYNF